MSRERVDQVDAREPVAVAIKEAAAEPHRWDARDVGAVVEGRAHDIELALEAPHAAQRLRDIVLCLQFATAKYRVLLRIDRLSPLDDSTCCPPHFPVCQPSRIECYVITLVTA